MIKLFLLVLFCVLALLSLWKRFFGPITFAAGFILIGFTQRHTVLFHSYSLWWFIIGLIIGEVLFFFSLSLIKLSLPEGFKLFLLDLGKFLKYHFSHIMVVLRYLMISTYEEVLWRGTIQYLLFVYLGKWGWAIFLTSVLFSLVHQYKEEIYLLEAFELFLFSCLLGYLFVRYNSIYFVIIVHAVRNINISCLKYSFRKESLHDIH